LHLVAITKTASKQEALVKIEPGTVGVELLSFALS
jgi:hypothetical protein